MWRCPVCEKERIQGLVCDNCGFDPSCSYEQNRTLCSVVPGHAEPISVRAEKWRQKQAGTSAPGILVCPRCGEARFYFLTDNMKFVCANCGLERPSALPENGPVSENDASEHEAAGVPADMPAVDPAPAEADPAPEPEPAAAPEEPASASEPAAEPAPTARIRPGDFWSTSDLLRIYFWIYLAAAAGLVLLAGIIVWTYMDAFRFVPDMIQNVFYYVVCAIFILRCRRRIDGLSNSRSTDRIRRAAISYGTVVLIRILFTALHQFMLWFNPDPLEYIPVMFLGSVFCLCAVSAVLILRRTGKLPGFDLYVSRFGTLIVCYVLFDVIYQFIEWFYPELIYPSFAWLADLIEPRH